MGPDSSDWGDDLQGFVPAQWSSLLGHETLAAIHRIGETLSARASSEEIVPAPRHVFRALEVAPQDVRVILVGQDPYPTPEHAMGWSFSVPRGVTPLPPSAKNIRTELREDMGVELPDHFELGHWVKQGVLLLNRHLTTAAGRPGAHHGVGWEAVTNRIVKVALENSPGCVGIIWGRAAAELVPLLGDIPRVESAHPSPLSAHRGFFGSQPFSAANALLEKLGQQPIDWSLGR